MQNYITALPSGTADGLPFGFAAQFLEAHYSRAAVSGAQMNANAVYEHGERCSLFGMHVHQAPAVTLTVFDYSGGFGKERVVAPFANVLPGMDPGAPLAHNDGSGIDQLAIENLGTEPLSS